MDKQNRLDLSKYRFEMALKALSTSKTNLELASDTNASVNRSYYAIFYTMLSVTSIDGFEASKHSVIIAYFNRNYVKTKIFDWKISNLISSAFEARGDADYKNFYIASTKQAQEQINTAETIINMIRPYLEARWAEMEEK